MDAIAKEQQKQEVGNQGIPKNKLSAREQLLDTAMYLVKAVRSFATDENNLVLLGHLAYSRSQLDSLADVQLLSACEIIVDKTGPYVASLDEYGVTAAHLANFKELISKFKQKQPSVKTVQGTSKAATDTLVELFTNTSSLLKNQMEGKMEQYKEKNPDFYNEYFNARNIIDPASRSRAKGSVPAE